MSLIFVKYLWNELELTTCTESIWVQNEFLLLKLKLKLINLQNFELRHELKRETLSLNQGGENCACHKCHASACPCACHAMHGFLQLFWHVFMFFEEKTFSNQAFRSSWRSDRCWLLIKSNLLGTFRKELVLFSNLCQKYDKFWLINSYFFNPLKLFGMSGACACNACHAHAMPCLRFLASFHTLTRIL